MDESDYENPWTQDGRPFSSSGLEDQVGFVYLITNLLDGRKYIGQKKLWSHKFLVKRFKNGKKGRRKVIIDSDWKTYYGSNKELQEDVKRLGASNFKREVIRVCKTKGLMNYEELREQMIHDVLRDDSYYNSFAGMRIHRAHVKGGDDGPQPGEEA